MHGQLLGFVTFVMWALIGGFFLVVVYQLLTKRINTKGLLTDKYTGHFSADRLTVLVLTLILAFFMIQDLAGNATAVPQIPESMVWVLGGSHLGYLGLKGRNGIFGNRNKE